MIAADGDVVHAMLITVFCCANQAVTPIMSMASNRMMPYREA